MLPEEQQQLPREVQSWLREEEEERQDERQQQQLALQRASKVKAEEKVSLWHSSKLENQGEKEKQVEH